MRILLLTICLLCVAAGHAQRTANLSITARIAPAPCRYPQACVSGHTSLPGRLVVDGNAVLYSGTQPVVENRDGLRIILF